MWRGFKKKSDLPTLFLLVHAIVNNPIFFSFNFILSTNMYGLNSVLVVVHFFCTPCIFFKLPHLSLILFTKCKKINWLAVCFCCCFIPTDLQSVRRFFFFIFYFFFRKGRQSPCCKAYAVSSLKTVTLQSLKTERGPYPTLIKVQINISNVILFTSYTFRPL